MRFRLLALVACLGLATLTGTAAAQDRPDRSYNGELTGGLVLAF